MLASPKAMSTRISQGEGIGAALDMLRLAHYTLHRQIRLPLAVAESVLPRPLATPVREAGRIGLMMGDAVEHLVEDTVHSLRDALRSDPDITLSPLEAKMFDRLLYARRGQQSVLATHYIRYFQHNARHVLESFGIQNYLLMEGALRDSFTALNRWADRGTTRRNQDQVERVFCCAAACFVELVYAAPLKVTQEAQFHIPILGDRGLQTYINQLIFGHLCYLSALGSLKDQLAPRPDAFYHEAARNDVIGEFTALLSATCLPDPHRAVADFFARRFRQSPINAGRQRPF